MGVVEGAGMEKWRGRDSLCCYSMVCIIYRYIGTEFVAEKTYLNIILCS